MKSTVIINGLNLLEDEINSMSKNIENIWVEFSNIQTKNIFNIDFISVMVFFSQNISVNLTYDVLKYVCLAIVNKLHHLNSKKETKIEIMCNVQVETLLINFELSEQQKDKIIDAVICKFTERHNNN